MKLIVDFFKRNNAGILLPIALLLIAAVSYGVTMTNHYPLVDYDEAIYAKVVVDTLESGDILSFKLSGDNWFEKPPLYLWLAMGATKIFGAQEFAFRLPSVLASLLALLLVYLIVMEFTGSRVASATAFLITLYSPVFFIFSGEVRMDSGVIMAMLAALFFFIKGWQDKRYLFWIFPAIAIGFLFKSVVIFLIVPILFLYSFSYRQWIWLKSKYLWMGFLASLVLLIPWHALQSFRFGSSFWENYLGYHVFQRVTSAIVGGSDRYDYIILLWEHHSPWFLVSLAIVALLSVLAVLKDFRQRIQWRQILTPLFAALFILVIFTLAKTHLMSYSMPIFPFLAMFIALSFYNFRIQFKNATYILPIVMLMLIIVGSVNSFSTRDLNSSQYYYEEREVGQLYKTLNEENPAPLQSLGWPFLQTFSYYGDTTVQYIDIIAGEAKEIKAPFYMITDSRTASLVFINEGAVISRYEYIKILYVGKNLILLYSDQDLILPILRPTTTSLPLRGKI